MPIARQIAEALEAAHDQRILHRDLKPANIKVRDDGTVKVLDFGLAKALTPESANTAMEDSPTLTARATQLGVILGTAAYMAPEQAKGKVVDRRADIWAFGVVVCEMLSGERMFKGEDVSDTLAAVLRQEINLSALPDGTPPRLKHLLERCLDRDPKQRLRDIGEARVELAKLQSGRRDASADTGVAVPTHADTRRWPRVVPWALTGLALAAVASALLAWAPWRADVLHYPVRLTADIGADASLLTGQGASAVLSPDGQTLAFAAGRDGPSQLYVRRLDQLIATPLPGTEDAIHPFYSPDGRWLGFFAGGKLKKVSLSGGAAIPLCDSASGRGTVHRRGQFVSGGDASTVVAYAV